MKITFCYPRCQNFQWKQNWSALHIKIETRILQVDIYPKILWFKFPQLLWGQVKIRNIFHSYDHHLLSDPYNSFTHQTLYAWSQYDTKYTNMDYLSLSWDSHTEFENSHLNYLYTLTNICDTYLLFLYPWKIKTKFNLQAFWDLIKFLESYKPNQKSPQKYLSFLFWSRVIVNEKLWFFSFFTSICLSLYCENI